MRLQIDSNPTVVQICFKNDKIIKYISFSLWNQILSTVGENMKTKGKSFRDSKLHHHYGFKNFQNLNFNQWIIWFGILFLCFSLFCSNWFKPQGQKSLEAIIVKNWEDIGNGYFLEKFFAYSAFYEYIGGDAFIKLIAATVPNTQRKMYCQLFNKDKIHYETVASNIQATRHASRELPISPVTVICKLHSLKQLPFSIRLSPFRNDMEWSSQLPAKLIPVLYNNPLDLETRVAEGAKYEFAACVQPTYNYNDIWQLLQWIEFQQLMGVEHFTLYNISIGQEASCLIRYYNERNSQGREIISVMPWHKIKEISEIHNNGQVMQANDCVARYKTRAKFVVILDFDEYIVPRINLPDKIKNYEELIKFALNNLDYGSMMPVQFQFRSGLFGLGWPQKSSKEDSEVSTIRNKLSLYKYTRRLKTIKPFHQRAKFITMPDYVVEPGIHSLTFAFPKNGIELLVPETIAYVHHYRECKWAKNCTGKESIEDKTGHFWAEKVLPRITKTYHAVNKLCDF